MLPGQILIVVAPRECVVAIMSQGYLVEVAETAETDGDEDGSEISAAVPPKSVICGSAAGEADEGVEKVGPDEDGVIGFPRTPIPS